MALKLKIGVDLGENFVEPRRFLECAILADKLGFDSLWFGDHFMPWFHGGGQAAYVWALMAACLQATERIRIGPDVTTPIGGRYHPAIIAQAAATLDSMYPGRFILGVGAGEAVNEAKFFEEIGRSWPRWRDRIDRLTEGIELIRRLWSTPDYFTFQGRYFKLRDVCLYTKPKTQIPILISALGPKAAEFAGHYGDGLMTIGSPSRCKNVIFPKFEKGALNAKKEVAEMEIVVPILFLIGDRDKSLKFLKDGRAGWLTKGVYNETDPRKVEASAAALDDKVLLEYFNLCESGEQLTEVVHDYVDIGVNHVVLSTGASMDLINLVAQKILPMRR